MPMKPKRHKHEFAIINLEFLRKTRHTCLKAYLQCKNCRYRKPGYISLKPDTNRNTAIQEFKKRYNLSL